jgi:MSHA pilin protein MshD
MRRRAQGLSLIELVIAVAVLTVAVGGVLLAITTSIGSSADPDRVQQATAIAEGYLEEIRLQPVDDPDGATVTEASRNFYDDIFDYDGLAEDPPRDQSGTPLPGLAGYAVSVAIVPLAALGPAGAQPPAADTYRVDVRVRYGNAIDLTLSTHRVRY